MIRSDAELAATAALVHYNSATGKDDEKAQTFAAVLQFELEWRRATRTGLPLFENCHHVCWRCFEDGVFCIACAKEY